MVEDANAVLSFGRGPHRETKNAVKVRGELPNEFVLSCDIALENATSVYGKPYPRIGAELFVTYTDNSVGYFRLLVRRRGQRYQETLNERIFTQTHNPCGQTTKYAA